eukprot:1149495-Pelagomonas_calceolata.AAC.14
MAQRLSIGSTVRIGRLARFPGMGEAAANLGALPPPKPVVIIISGPSGVGKDAVVQKLKEARSDLYFVVTATSR